MKKMLNLAVMLLGVALFTACENDDVENHGTEQVWVNSGVYVVCSGSQSSGINSALTYFEYATKKNTLNIFKESNGRELGLTANDALRYGDKLYIVVDGENSVFVTNAKTLKVLHTIKTTDATMLGEQGGKSPRRIAAYEGNIYVSTFGGYVAAIDTVNFALKEKYQVGSYPEGVAISSDGIMYVANSDYGYGNASISKINIATSETETLTNENIRNPQTIAIYGTGFYFLDYGVYGPAPDYAQQHAGVYRYSYGTVTQVVPNATGMAAYGQTILTYNTPYGGDGVSYSMYDVSSGTLSSYQPKDIEYPAAIEIDPVTGYVIIASYKMVTSEWGTYPDYTSNGYVNIYADDFNTVSATFECGVSPTRIVLNPSIVTVNY